MGGEGGNSPENLTIVTDPRFEIVTDKVPLVSSWGLSRIMPRPGLIEAAVVQRTAQLHSPYYRLKPPEGKPLKELPLSSLGIGLEDKKLGADVEYFAREGEIVRQGVRMRFPGQEEMLDNLVENWQIQNSGNPYGRLQLLMLVQLDSGIAALVSRLNRHEDRKKGHPSYDFRQRIYDFLRSTGVPEERLVEYTNGERHLALPKEESLSSSEGWVDLEASLRRLTPEKLKDWRFLRSAVFMLSDPRVREVLEANREIRPNVDVITEIQRVSRERVSKATRPQQR